MNCYNGEKYLQEAIDSVYAQSYKNWEIIFWDNASKDLSANIAKSYDSKVKYFFSNKTISLGHARNKAIEQSKGSYVAFLDVDDIWYPNKVKSIVNLFNKDIFVTLVITDTNIIDGNNKVMAESYFKKRGGFKVGLISNLIKNKYLGCTMAFKPEMRRFILPFPDKIPSHDMWIGLMNSIYGEIRFIDIPLVGYRRHNANVSPIVHQSIWKIIIWRLIFIYRLFQRILKVLFEKL